MRRTFAAVFALLAGLLPAAAQVPPFPSTLPASTVVGRSAISSGPSQAIPFATLYAWLYATGVLPVANGGTNCSVASGTCLDNIAGFASTGILARTAAGTYGFRTLTAPAAGISVSNGNGVAGNPTLALANDLAALEGLSSTGFAARTTTDTWAQRTITGTANEVTVTNGDGVSGNPTVSLPSSLTFTGKTITGGSHADTAVTANSLTPVTSGATTLGTAALPFGNAFLAGSSKIDIANGDIAITWTTNLLRFTLASGGYSFDALIWPATTNAIDIGSTLFRWNTIYGNTANLGSNGGTGGSVKLFGSTSGDVTIQVPAAAGTATNFKLPNNNGSSGYLLKTDGSGNTDWINASGTGTVTSVVCGTQTVVATGTCDNAVHLETLTASNSASLTSAANFATYNRYIIVFTNILPASNTVSCRIRVNVSGVQTSGYTGGGNLTAGGVNYPESITTYVPCSMGSRLANTGIGTSGSITIFKPSQTSAPKPMVGAFVHRDTSNSATGVYSASGSYDGGNGAVSGIEVTMSTGNITSGTIDIYGSN